MSILLLIAAIPARLRSRAGSAVVRLLCITSLAIATSATAFPSVYPYGLTVYVPGKVYPGFVVFTGRDGLVYAVAPHGAIARTWTSPIAGATFGYARPLPNGNLLARMSGTTAPTIAEVDQQGNLVWQYEGEAGLHFHHDQDRLINGNTLILCSRDIVNPAVASTTITDDCLLEVDPSGNVVWDWQTADHFDDFGFTDDVKALIDAQAGDWAHANAASPLPPNDLTDPRFRQGNILVSYRHLSMIVIVDRQTGDIVWNSRRQTIGQHNPQMIPSYLPGGNNILVFDNGFPGRFYYSPDPADDPPIPLARDYSRVIEINPFDHSVPYEYTGGTSGEVGWSFNAAFVSSAQRLPNGNTFIDEGPNGRFFEVTPDGEIVWEYISPIIGTLQGHPSNLAYRATKAWFWPF